MPRVYLDDNVSVLRGVGESKTKQLERIGIRTVRDLLYYFPRAYERRGDIRMLSQADDNQPSSFLLTIGTRVTTAKIRNGYSISKFRAFDESGSVEVMFFNSPFIKDVFHLGTVFRFYGKLSFFKGQPILQSPKYEAFVEGIPLKNYVPVYSLTEGLTSNAITKIVEQCIDEALPSLIDSIPEELRLSEQLPTLNYAIRAAHFPQTDAELSSALRRLAFDEMFLFALKIATSKKERVSRIGITIPHCSVSDFTKLLPYELTASQKQAVNEIYRDMTHKNADGNTPSMARLLVGDVGSGKTVCAMLAAYIAIKGGFQAALMVPTEILARQHYSEISSFFSKLGIRTALLLGATPASEKKRIYQDIACGSVDMIIGTHALLSEKVNFSSLGLVITDEQHRFGVLQRASLKNKNEAAHLLVMSATPIPRTLALTLYGDLDVSKITELPRGRQPIDTFLVDDSYEPRILSFIQKQVGEGGQCYVICPAIEAEEDDCFTPDSIDFDVQAPPKKSMKTAVDYADYLIEKLPALTVACLHGKMNAAQKDQTMRDFSDGRIQVLVSTTVIEVGINVPNSNLMIIQNAERFGLSQLHQLRGRVGRGASQSYCVLVTDYKLSEDTRKRMEIMTTSNDGFEIAEADLKLRGPGDMEGTQQSGIAFDLKIANLARDEQLLQLVREVARGVIDADPAHDNPAYRMVWERLRTIKNMKNWNWGAIS